MKIGFIGAGKVGSAFGHFLKNRGFEVIGYYSLSFESAARAAQYTDTKVFSFDELVCKSEFIFITTPDDVISKIWGKLKAHNLQDKKIFHMSGVQTTAVFEAIDEKGAYGFSLHPLFPFSDIYNYEGLNDATFTIEGKNFEIIEDFLSMSKIKYFRVNGEQKAKYHAAAVFSSNYIVALADISKKLMIECGIQGDQAETALYPLMNSTLMRIRDKGVKGALTGPVVRGDVDTVRKHREAIGGFKQIYDSLGRIALEIACENSVLSNTEIMKLNKIFGGDGYEKDYSNL